MAQAAKIFRRDIHSLLNRVSFGRQTAFFLFWRACFIQEGKALGKYL